jgi:nitrogenase iron protein NifH
MNKIAFIGKGGIGKTTIASNVSAALAITGRKVLHIGCDPKHDSTLALMGRTIPTFAGSNRHVMNQDLERSIHRARLPSLECLEAGGPEPGIGCAGMGIGLMIEALTASAWLQKGRYDTVVFDILGDVVCGGFAAPLRRGFADYIALVVSEEALSLYSANNLLKMIRNCSGERSLRCGLVANLRDPASAGTVLRFSRQAGIDILGIITAHPEVARAEKRRCTVMETAPNSAIAQALRSLAVKLASAAPSSPMPTPMSEEEFALFSTGAKPAPASAPIGSRPPRAKTGAKARIADLGSIGLRLREINCDRIACDLDTPGGPRRVFIHKSASSHARPDWIIPAGPRSDPELGRIVARAQKSLAHIRFEDLVTILLERGVTLRTIAKQFQPPSPEPGLAPEPGAMTNPYLSLGARDKFIFRRHPASRPILALPTVVEHGDSECMFDDCGSVGLGFFAPGVAQHRKRLPLAPFTERRVINTGFDAGDTVHGSCEKLERTLMALAKRKPRPKFIEVYRCCTPLVLQEDLSRVCADVGKRTGIKILLENYNNPEDPLKPGLRAEALVETLRASARNSIATYHVNLLGWPEAFHRSLSRLLELHGIRTAPFPRRDIDAARAIAASRIQIAHGQPDAAMALAFKRLRIRTLTLPAPFGIRATERWLDGVLRALKRRPRASLIPKAVLAEQRRLAAHCRGFKAGFVVSVEELGWLLNPEPAAGIPSLDMLREMGFGILVFLRDDAGAGDRDRSILVARARRLYGAKILTFSTPARLRRLLIGDAALRLVYSDLRADPRIIALGKSALSSADFEPAFDGALATTRRLLKRCSWNFYGPRPNA